MPKIDGLKLSVLLNELTDRSNYIFVMISADTITKTPLIDIVIEKPFTMKHLNQILNLKSQSEENVEKNNLNLEEQFKSLNK